MRAILLINQSVSHRQMCFRPLLVYVLLNSCVFSAQNMSFYGVYGDYVDFISHGNTKKIALKGLHHPVFA